MARKVDISLLHDMVKDAENQEVVKGGFSRSEDANFPVFSTPVNKDILVYIPMLNVVETENGSTMKLLNTYLHTYREGKYTSMLRCVSGLNSGVYANELGYDGTCPACEATKDAWALYNLKLAAEAAKLNIDVQNDTGDVLKTARTNILKEMDMKGAEEYVTFPIVIIPTQEAKFAPTPDALSHLQVQFVVWRKKRYDDNILAALDSLMENPGHPGGMFFRWKFSYNTEGKPANARDSAKNAKYILITEPAFLNALSKAKPALEAAAKDFTNEKAVEVVVSNQIMYADDMASKVNKIMAKTRQMLEMSETGSIVGHSLEASPLSKFGGIPETTAQNLGVEAPAVTTAPAAPATDAFSSFGDVQFGQM